MAKRKAPAANKRGHGRRKRAVVNREKRLNTAELEQAINRATKEIEKPNTEAVAGRYVIELLPSIVQTRAELFQPRRFSFTLYEVDQRHVNHLAGRITRKGELDPIVVVKLKGEPYFEQPVTDEWVVVDGHHRLAAYKQLEWPGTIKCEWFAGTVLEALDESLAANEKIKLKVPLADRQGRAWDRVLLGIGSKKEITRLSGVAEGTVALMRRVKAAYEGRDDFAKAFKTRLGRELKRATWGEAQMAFIDATPGTVRIFVFEAVIGHAFTKRSLNMTANCVFASAHSRGGRFHSAAAWFKTKYSSLAAASSDGKCPLVRTARRSFEFNASIAFVV